MTMDDTPTTPIMNYEGFSEALNDIVQKAQAEARRGGDIDDSLIVELLEGQIRSLGGDTW